MNIRRTAAALSIGALTFVGGFAATPEEAENGCQGVNEAQGEEGGNGNAAAEALEDVEQLLAGEDGCDGHGSASGDNGRPDDDS